MTMASIIYVVGVSSLILIHAGTREPPSGLYFKLNNTVYHPGDCIPMTSIGSQPNDIADRGSTLVCVTTNVNRKCCRPKHTNDTEGTGYWYYPNGSSILGGNQSVRRVRYEHEVRISLSRTMLQYIYGKYTCSIPSNGTLINATINLISKLYFKLEDTIYISGDSIDINDIGFIPSNLSDVGSTLVCTICELKQNNKFRGHWYFNSSKVSNDTMHHRQENFTQYKYMNQIHLARRAMSEGPLGEYICKVNDSGDTLDGVISIINMISDKTASSNDKNMGTTTLNSVYNTNNSISNNIIIIAIVVIILIFVILVIVVILLFLTLPRKWKKRMSSKVPNINIRTTDNYSSSEQANETVNFHASPMQDMGASHYEEIDKVESQATQDIKLFDLYDSVKPGEDDISSLYSLVDKKKGKYSGKMSKDNLAAGTSDVYAVVNKSKKKNEESDNVRPDISEMYAVVDKTKKKKENTANLSNTYAVVDKACKKKT